MQEEHTQFFQSKIKMFSVTELISLDSLLGRIKFGLNLEAYSKLDALAEEFRQNYKSAQIYKKDSKNVQELSTYVNNIDKAYKNFLSYTQSVKNGKWNDILTQDVKEFNILIRDHNEHEAVGFLKDLIESDKKEPTIYFGTMNVKSAVAYYERAHDAVYIDINQSVRDAKGDAFSLLPKEELKKRLIGEVTHEFIHRFDHCTKAVSDFYGKQYKKIVYDCLREIPNEPERFTEILTNKMKSIAVIMESIASKQIAI